MENRFKSYNIKNPLTRIQTYWYKYLLARKVAPITQPEIPKIVPPLHLYARVCSNRYNSTRNMFDKQFLKDIRNIEQNQATGWEAMRIRRLFSITVFWPPMHTKRDIRKSFQNPDMLKRTQEQKRLDRLLNS